MKILKLFFLATVFFVSSFTNVNSQIVLPSLQSSSYVPIKLEITGISGISDNAANVFVRVSASTNGRTAIGVCYSTAPNPTLANNVANYGGALLIFNLNITAGVNPNTLYYVRPFVTIGGITSYGDNVVFTTTNGLATPVDNSLNYVTMRTPGGQYADNEAEFDSQIAPGYGNIIQTGVANINVIINFTSSANLATAGISTGSGNNFSIVATGFFIPQETGIYTFSLGSDDAGDLFINNVNITNDYGGQALAAIGANPGTINLTAGTKYSFRARMQEFAGGEGLRIYWRRPSQTTGWFQNAGEVSSF